jgi:polyisoprenoid-binding protein YceI
LAISYGVIQVNIKIKCERFWCRAARPALVGALLVLVAAQAWTKTLQAPAQTSVGEITLNLDPAKSKLSWTLGSTLHTVHGTFNLKSGTMRFNPTSGSASGEFVAYATSGESGNDGRDKKMHKEILESARYPDVIFRPTKIEGTVAPQGASNVQLHGTFLLHGSEHEITVPVQAELSGDSWKGSTKFSIPYVAWGLKSPNTFLLKADPAVQIELELNGKLEGHASQ